jgi:hypothetical protein
MTDVKPGEIHVVWANFHLYWAAMAILARRERLAGRLTQYDGPDELILLHQWNQQECARPPRPVEPANNSGSSAILG